MLMLPDASMNSSNLTADLADFEKRIHILCTLKERHDQIAGFIQISFVHERLSTHFGSPRKDNKLSI